MSEWISAIKRAIEELEGDIPTSWGQMEEQLGVRVRVAEPTKMNREQRRADHEGVH
jgi:hypothetical protein